MHRANFPNFRWVCLSKGSGGQEQGPIWKRVTEKRPQNNQTPRAQLGRPPYKSENLAEAQNSQNSLPFHLDFRGGETPGFVSPWAQHDLGPTNYAKGMLTSK